MFGETTEDMCDRYIRDFDYTGADLCEGLSTLLRLTDATSFVQEILGLDDPEEYERLIAKYSQPAA